MTGPGIIWPSEDLILQAIARGWCHEKNKYKEMDSDLAVVICQEVVLCIRANTKLVERLAGEIILEPMPGIKRIMTKVWKDNERDDDDFLSATCTETGQGITLEAIGFQIRKDDK